MKYRFIIIKPDTESNYPDTWVSLYVSHTYYDQEDCERTMKGMLENYNSSVIGEVVEIKVKIPGI